MIYISMTEKAKSLVPLLRELYDDDNYVQGVILNAENDENIEILKNFIDYANKINDPITSDDIAALALVLGNKTNKAVEGE